MCATRGQAAPRGPVGPYSARRKQPSDLPLGERPTASVRLRDLSMGTIFGVALPLAPSSHAANAAWRCPYPCAGDHGHPRHSGPRSAGRSFFGQMGPEAGAVGATLRDFNPKSFRTQAAIGPPMRRAHDDYATARIPVICPDAHVRDNQR